MKNDKGKNGCAELEDVVAFINSYLGVGDFKDYDGPVTADSTCTIGKIISSQSKGEAP